MSLFILNIMALVGIWYLIRQVSSLEKRVSRLMYEMSCILPIVKISEIKIEEIIKKQSEIEPIKILHKKQPEVALNFPVILRTEE